MPSETTGSSKEPTLLALFIEESAHRIEVLDTGSARLSSVEAEPALVDALWREAHTLKGGASMVGMVDVVDLAAEIEAILGAVRDGRLTVSDALLEDLRDAIVELRETRDALAGSSAPTEPRAAVPAGHGRGTVLVVDDDQVVRELLRRMLASDGYQVVAVEAAGPALAVLAERSVDIVVTDVAMPGGDGAGLVQSIRSDPATKDVPVVVLSALRDGDDGSDLLASGADAVLSKSTIDRAGLTALVERYVSRSSREPLGRPADDE